MHPEASRSRSGLVLLFAGCFMAILSTVFAFVPLVECRRCDKDGQFAVKDGTRVLGFDYCDCASFFLLGSTGITINASAKVTVNASSVAISAGMMTVDAGMSKFSGVVQADTLIANSVVSSSYTPGAGNVW